MKPCAKAILQQNRRIDPAVDQDRKAALSMIIASRMTIASEDEVKMKVLWLIAPVDLV